MRRWNQIALVLVCAAVFAACETQPNEAASGGATRTDPASCHSSCDAAYDRCASACQQTDNNMCASECVDQIESCKKHCG
jgi:hypothetical protein